MFVGLFLVASGNHSFIVQSYARYLNTLTNLRAALSLYPFLIHQYLVVSSPIG